MVSEDRKICSGEHIHRNQLEEKLNNRISGHPLILTNKCFHLENLSELDISNVDFTGSSFRKAKFIGKETILSGVIFRDCDLQNADFSFANLTKSIFDRADLSEANLRRTNLTNASFKQSKLHGTRLYGAKLNNTTGLKKESFGNKIGEEIRGDYITASETYLALRNNFNLIGDYDSSSWAYFRERVCKRKSHSPKSAIRFYGKMDYKDDKGFLYYFDVIRFWFKNNSYIKWLYGILQEVLWGYAQKPNRVLAWSFVIVMFFAFIYWKLDLVCYGETTCIPAKTDPSVFSYVLFSLAAFSTSSVPNMIGATKIANFFTSFEGIIGVTFLALFTTSLASRLGDIS